MAALVFLSYARDDVRFASELYAHLKALEHEGLAEIWFDQRHLMAGDAFDASIADTLSRADMVLLLVSSAYLGSSYAYRNELPRAMARQAAGEAIVVPIILRACVWQSLSFGHLHALPSNDRPVDEWERRDDAYEDIVRGLLTRLLDSGVRARSTVVSETSRARDAQAVEAGTTLPFARASRYLPRAVMILMLAALLVTIGWLVYRIDPKVGPAPEPRWLEPSGVTSANPGGSIRSGTAGPDAPVASVPTNGGAGVTPPVTPASDAVQRGSPESDAANTGAETPRPREPASVRAPSADAPPPDVSTPDGVLVLAEFSLVDAQGRAWDEGRAGVWQLPDLFLCFRRSTGGRETCKPTLGDMSGARIVAHANVSHLADSYASLTSWSGEFAVVAKNQQFASASILGRGNCRFGHPCAIATGGVVIGEVLVLPAWESADALRARFLAPCVAPGSLLLAQALALRAAAGFEGVDPASVSYEALALTLTAAESVAPGAGLVDAAIAGRASSPATPVYRGSLLEHAARGAEGGDGKAPDSDDWQVALAQLGAALRAPRIADAVRRGCSAPETRTDD